MPRYAARDVQLAELSELLQPPLDRVQPLSLESDVQFDESELPSHDLLLPPHESPLELHCLPPDWPQEFQLLKLEQIAFQAAAAWSPLQWLELLEHVEWLLEQDFDAHELLELDAQLLEWDGFTAAQIPKRAESSNRSSNDSTAATCVDDDHNRREWRREER